MSQTIAIILSFPIGKAQQFEQLFSDEVFPLWTEFKSQGKILAASLSPAQDTPGIREGVQQYILLVEVPGTAEHDAFEADSRFVSFLQEARPWQPTKPEVWVGNTLFKV